MAIILTAKEKMFLQDQKLHEELCIQKYQNYSNQAQDPQLKQLFSTLAQKEQEHLNSINQILNGQVPNVQQNVQGQQTQQNNQWTQQSQQQNNQSAQQMQQNQGNQRNAAPNQNDRVMCTDMLETEKHVSVAYDTTIFECVDTNVRKVLNHIQKEEQEHGEQIFIYMKNNNMYNPQ